jgi:putative Mg2+ transporter-C (MgtC) family protein
MGIDLRAMKSVYSTANRSRPQKWKARAHLVTRREPGQRRGTRRGKRLSRLQRPASLLGHLTCASTPGRNSLLVSLAWHDIALRLALTFVTATLVGIDRGEHRRPVGVRTTLLLSLAACIAMLETNLLLTTSGKAADSIVNIDPMRLPLGILSGVGFIGAGAILKRGDLVLGVTTAATMWFVTVMGLCFGSGHIGLGLAAFALAMLVLVAMRWVEDLLPKQQGATLCMTVAADGFHEEEFRAALETEGRKITSWNIHYVNLAQVRKVMCELHWRSRKSRKETPAFVEQLARRPDVTELEWKE